MRRIDHDALRFGSFPGKASEDAIEHAHQAPADEAIVERLVRAVAGWRVLPLKPVADHVDYATHHPPVIHPRNTVRKREERRYPSHLALAQQKQITHHSPHLETVNHISNRINGS